jgi:DNA invertase Pin-like site-specific DNA recombinase
MRGARISVPHMSSTISNQPILCGGPLISASRRAAQYIRMSTDHQRYSIENQKVVIAEYAFIHGSKIVRACADEGRSGVTIKHRDALQQLIDDVEWGHADFETILVHDVGRWSRLP